MIAAVSGQIRNKADGLTRVQARRAPKRRTRSTPVLEQTRSCRVIPNKCEMELSVRAATGKYISHPGRYMGFLPPHSSPGNSALLLLRRPDPHPCWRRRLRVQRRSSTASTTVLTQPAQVLFKRSFSLKNCCPPGVFRSHPSSNSRQMQVPCLDSNRDISSRTLP